MAVQRTSPRLNAAAGVLGTAVGVGAWRCSSVTVYVDRDAANAGKVVTSLPRELRGVGVHVHLTDKFADGSHSQTNATNSAWTFGWSVERSCGCFCSAAPWLAGENLVPRSTFLSNYHVFESDIVSAEMAVFNDR